MACLISVSNSANYIVENSLDEIEAAINAARDIRPTFLRTERLAEPHEPGPLLVNIAEITTVEALSEEQVVVNMARGAEHWKRLSAEVGSAEGHPDDRPEPYPTRPRGGKP